MADGEQLIRMWIQADSTRHGAEEARIAKYGVSVWAIVGYWRVVGEHLSQVAKDYEIPEDAVRAALEYYERHRAAIEERLDANAA